MKSARQQAKSSRYRYSRAGRTILAAALLLGVLVATETTIAPPTARAMGVLHVDVAAAPGGDGTTWASAFDDLQDALAVASSGADIWIAEGTYYPTSGTDRSIGFEIPDGVSLYGGFLNGDIFSKRDTSANVVLLSGDIGVPGLTSDNSYQVVKVVDLQVPPDPITIDGLQIRYGRADGGVSEVSGAALYIRNGQGLITINDVVLAQNEAVGVGSVVDHSFGGAEFVMTNSLVTDNGDPVGASPDLDVGRPAMHFFGVAATLDNVDIVDNRIGGLYVRGATGTLAMRKSTVSGNGLVPFQGANAIQISGPEATIVNTTIQGNGDGTGSALFIAAQTASDTVVTLVNTVIANNRNASAPNTSRGPGITLRGGQAFGGGDTYARLIADNVTLAYNRHGAVFNCNDVADNLMIPDVAGNRVGGVAGGALLASATFDNSIIWDNQGCTGGVPAVPTRTPDASVITWKNSVVRASGGSGGGWNTDLGVDGGGNVDADPDFIDDESCWCTTTDYRLRSGSPALGIGNNALLPPDNLDLDDDNNTVEPLPVDLNGDERITDGTVDAGAYEGLTCLPTITRLYVRQGFNGQGNTWIDAFAELRDALSFAALCDNLEEIWLGIGTYTPSATGDRAASFLLPGGVTIYGGFSGGETLLSERIITPFLVQSILSGEIGSAGLADNSYHVVRADTSSADGQLDGVWIRHGNANNVAVSNGGKGGGILIETTSGVVIANSIISDNAGLDGGGIAAPEPGDALVTNVTIRDNTANNGAGLFVEEANVVVVNSIIHDNAAAVVGGGIRYVDAGAELINTTVVENTAPTGSGIAFSAAGGLIQNSIVWDNAVSFTGGGPKWEFSDIEGSSAVFPGLDLGGNLDSDPLLNFDFRPGPGSPATDAGATGAVPADVVDIDDDGDVAERTPDRSRNTRVIGSAVDMGAYEGADSDGDGVSDFDDNCPNTSNALQFNADGDALGDACDPDDDNDGLLDGADNCRVDANPGQENFDGDAQGDACDPDDDNDGLPDNIDNCSLNSDPSQTDRDHDGLGNVCDPDDDNDGVLDDADNCQFHVNPDQADSDGDGVGDVCDTPDPVVPGLIDPLVPARILDTRTGPGAETTDGLFEGEGQRVAGSTLELTVAGRGGVDIDADAAVLNITAVAPVANGFITVFPCGTDRPTASSLNYVAGENVPNLVIAKIGDGGKVCIYTREATHLLADVSGSAPPDTTYQSLDPVRLLDTRSAGETIDGQFAGDGVTLAGGVVELTVAGRDAVPADAEAVVLNVTSVGSTVAGFVTVYACGSPRPNASNLNHRVGVNRPNLVVAPIGDGGKVCIFTSGVTHLLADVGGAFGPGSGYTVLEPARLVDTRASGETVDSLSEAEGVRPAGSTLVVQVGGRAGVAGDAEAAVLNVSVVGPLGAGFATVYPCDEARPTASNLNFTAGLTAPNLVLAKLSTAGTVCVFTSASTHLIVDVSGTI